MDKRFYLHNKHFVSLYLFQKNNFDQYISNNNDFRTWKPSSAMVSLQETLYEKIWCNLNFAIIKLDTTNSLLGLNLISLFTHQVEYFLEPEGFRPTHYCVDWDVVCKIHHWVTHYTVLKLAGITWQLHHHNNLKPYTEKANAWHDPGNIV